KRLEYQAGHAIVWRDAVVNWFNRISGIPDAQDRVGHHPDRIEAENMQLSGYAPIDVTPWETASGGKAVACTQTECSASFQFSGSSGTYLVAIQYFDQNNGVSKYQLLLMDKLLIHWLTEDVLPSAKMIATIPTRNWPEGRRWNLGDLVRFKGS